MTVPRCAKVCYDSTPMTPKSFLNALLIPSPFLNAVKGTTPNMARNSIVSSSELVTYDVFKTWVLKHGWMEDNVICHFSSAFAAGVVTTIVASPVDVIKTRIMNSGKGVYRGTLHCAQVMLHNEGLTAFYKG